MAERTVDSREMMEARDRRASRQRELLSAYGGCLVSFTLNVPGPVKLTPLLEQVFEEGRRRISEQLRRFRHPVRHEESAARATGCEGFWAVDGEALAVKREMVLVEEDHPLGRLFDIDVLRADAVPLTRDDLGAGLRRCLVCEAPAHECARARRHPLPELLSALELRAREFFLEQRADAVAAMACRAMLYEVSVTPKPGLVDRADSGAHRDMDFFTFLDSISALTPRFRDLFLLGARHCALAPSELFARLRYPGMEAEEEMRRATGGVNTHKGLIFSLGLLCAALGRRHARGETSDVPGVLALAAEMAREALARELSAAGGETGGLRLHAAAGRGGVRGEAMQGFPTVRDHGLPALRRHLAAGRPVNDAGALTLLVLMGEAADSNVFARRGLPAQRELAARMRELGRREPPPSLEELSELNRAFVRDDVSPGGAADLLALCFFLHFLEGEARGDGPRETPKV